LAALLASEKATRNSIIEKGVKTERERDEARADLVAEIKHHWDTTIKIACKLELEHNELREQNAKLRDIAERALNFGEYRAPYLGYPGPTWEKLRAELDQLKEGAKCPVCSPEQKCWECADDVSQEGVE
jgi:DNA repair exonuclease SbcCD ATPase subunit